MTYRTYQAIINGIAIGLLLATVTSTATDKTSAEIAAIKLALDQYSIPR